MKTKKNRKDKGLTANYCRPYDKESRRKRAEITTKEQRKPKRVIDYLVEYDEGEEDDD